MSTDRAAELLASGLAESPSAQRRGRQRKKPVEDPVETPTVVAPSFLTATGGLTPVVVMKPVVQPGDEPPCQLCPVAEVTAQAGTSALGAVRPARHRPTRRLDQSRTVHAHVAGPLHVQSAGRSPYDYFQEVGTGLYGPLHHWITPSGRGSCRGSTRTGTGSLPSGFGV